MNKFIKKIYSKKSIEKYQKKEKLLGIDNHFDVSKYLTVKLIILIMIFAISLIIFNMGYIIAPLITIVFYYVLDYITLDLKIKKRISILEHDAIFFFEVLTLTLQSESNLKLCLESGVNAIDSTISSEFKEVLKEVDLGKSLNEALEELKNRIPSKEVNNVILNIIESNTYGTSIIDALNNQVSYLTEKRIMNIKADINKMPTKISIVSVIIFVPLIMLLILGPMLINIIMK